MIRDITEADFCKASSTLLQLQPSWMLGSGWVPHQGGKYLVGQLTSKVVGCICWRLVPCQVPQGLLCGLSCLTSLSVTWECDQLHHNVCRWQQVTPDWVGDPLILTRAGQLPRGWEKRAGPPCTWSRSKGQTYSRQAEPWQPWQWDQWQQRGEGPGWGLPSWQH